LPLEQPAHFELVGTWRPPSARPRRAGRHGVLQAHPVDRPRGQQS